MKRNKPRTLQVGEISSGTLRSEDLLDSYLWHAERLRLSRDERAIVREIRAKSEAAMSIDEDMPDAVEDLATILEAHCPPYCYFGSLEGDGACFGVWPSLDSLQREMDDEGWRVEDTDRNGGGIRVSPDGRWRYVVSDHGNVTLYRNGREVWSVV